ncbi:hypothetical protein GW17_00016614, partial [Ensete ventricosum]
ERERGQYREDGVAEVAVDVANVLRNDLGRHFRVAKGLSAYICQGGGGGGVRRRRGRRRKQREFIGAGREMKSSPFLFPLGFDVFVSYICRINGRDISVPSLFVLLDFFALPFVLFAHMGEQDHKLCSVVVRDSTYVMSRRFDVSDPSDMMPP